jgi:hypothetical protein
MTKIEEFCIDGVMSAVEVVHKDDEEVIRLSLSADKYLEGVEIN